MEVIEDVAKKILSAIDDAIKLHKKRTILTSNIGTGKMGEHIVEASLRA